MQKTKEYLEYIVKMIVADKNSVVVNAKNDERGVLMTLTVAKEDMGRIIGREGETAKAIRSIIKVFGMKNNARVNIKIIQNN